MAKGLSSAEAQQRLQQYGPNQLAEKKKEPGWQAFLRQYQGLMQIVLLGAAVLNQIFAEDWGPTLVLIGLTIFNEDEATIDAFSHSTLSALHPKNGPGRVAHRFTVFAGIYLQGAIGVFFAEAA